jgi:hypothetical protein
MIRNTHQCCAAMVDLGLSIPCIKPSEEQLGRGFCDQCLSEADAFVFEAERVLSATDCPQRGVA